jgi:hypothetical protein
MATETPPGLLPGTKSPRLGSVSNRLCGAGGVADARAGPSEGAAKLTDSGPHIPARAGTPRSCILTGTLIKLFSGGSFRCNDRRLAAKDVEQSIGQ